MTDSDKRDACGDKGAILGVVSITSCRLCLGLFCVCCANHRETLRWNIEMKHYCSFWCILYLQYILYCTSSRNLFPLSHQQTSNIYRYIFCLVVISNTFVIDGTCHLYCCPTESLHHFISPLLPKFISEESNSLSSTRSCAAKTRHRLYPAIASSSGNSRGSNCGSKGSNNTDIAHT